MINNSNNSNNHDTITPLGCDLEGE